MSSVQVYYVLTYVSSLSVLLPIIISLIRYRAFNIQLKALFLYLVLSLLNELVCYFMLLHKKDTWLSFEIFAFLEGIFIMYIYSRQFNFTQTRMYLLFSLVAILCLAPYIFPRVTSDFSSAAISGLIIILAVYSFYKIFIALNVPLLSNYYFFWINTAFLFYFGATILLSLFGRFIRNSNESTAIFLWTIQLFANIIRNLILSEGIWQAKKT